MRVTYPAHSVCRWTIGTRSVPDTKSKGLEYEDRHVCRSRLFFGMFGHAKAAFGQDRELEEMAVAQPADVRPYDNWAKPQEYLLRYKFHAGDALRWTVVHRSQIHTSISGTAQTAETTTSSVKVWRVHEVKSNGQIVFDHMVESVDMRHRLTGRDEVHYNSLTDRSPPRGLRTWPGRWAYRWPW